MPAAIMLLKILRLKNIYFRGNLDQKRRRPGLRNFLWTLRVGIDYSTNRTECACVLFRYDEQGSSPATP
jgi:hypothetical protein